MMKLRHYFIFIFLFHGVEINAQDPHLSQYFSNPLALNPAQTGNIEGEFRIQSAFRNQWGQNGFPYTTMILSTDIRALKGRLLDNSKLGFGLTVNKDASLAGAFKKTNLNISAGYHQSISEDGFQTIGVGLQGVYASRFIDFTNIGFQTQFTGSDFNLNIPSQENFNGTNIHYFDLNSGILYAYNNGENSFYAGFALHNVLKPVFTLFSDSSSKISQRQVLNGGSNIYNPNTNGRIAFSFMLMNQAKNLEVNIGAAYGFSIKENYLFLGLFSRFKDAIYPYLSYQTNALQVGFSYDITTSFLRNVRSRLNSIEFSLMYTRPDQSQNKRYMPWNF